MSCGGCGKSKFGTPGFTLTGGCLCSIGTDFTTVDQAGGGVVGSLIGTADEIRDLQTQLGARTSTVSLIWTKWSGGARGVGEEYVFNEEVILPNPLVGAATSIKKDFSSVGLSEMGTLKVSEISLRYEEGHLLGMIDGVFPGEDVNFYWEVVFASNAIRRRFFPASPPDYDETAFQWTILLVRATGDRAPNALPRGNPEAI